MIGNTEVILLVDDEATVRSVLREALERAGFTVIEAGNYYEAIREAGNIEFLDLLIADVSLPGPNGCELAARLQALRPDLKVLFISGYTGAEVCRHYGVEVHDLQFMAKPLDLRAFVKRVRALLDVNKPEDGNMPMWIKNPDHNRHQ